MAENQTMEELKPGQLSPRGLIVDIIAHHGITLTAHRTFEESKLCQQCK